MSEGFQITLGGADEGYRIETVENCKIIFGSVPVNDLVALAGLVGADACMAADIAARIGAALVMGQPADLDRLRARGLPVSDERRHDANLAQGLEVPAAVATWLMDGNRGMSSDALCKRLFGIPARAGTDHPRDPGDLSRCIEFLDTLGSERRATALQEMRDVTPEWGKLIARWSQIEECYHAESGSSKPKTYALMREVLA